MTTRLVNGRIIHLDKETEEKIAIGRVLNLFSLCNLPRCIFLNFDDVTKSGFVFDSFTGKFPFDKGNVRTHNTEVRGSIADVSISGRVSLVKRDFDLIMHIMPYITGPIPLISTLIGGPIVGGCYFSCRPSHEYQGPYYC